MLLRSRKTKKDLERAPLLAEMEAEIAKIKDTDIRLAFNRLTMAGVATEDIQGIREQAVAAQAYAADTVKTLRVEAIEKLRHLEKIIGKPAYDLELMLSGASMKHGLTIIEAYTKILLDISAKIQAETPAEIPAVKEEKSPEAESIEETPEKITEIFPSTQAEAWIRENSREEKGLYYLMTSKIREIFPEKRYFNWALGCYYDAIKGVWRNSAGKPLCKTCRDILDLISDGYNPDGPKGGKPMPEEAPSENSADVIVKVQGGEDLPCRYEVLDISEIQASHIPHENFRVNPCYHYENERRYHAGGRDLEKVIQIAGSLDPAYIVADSPTGLEGAPVVDRDNNVIGGNGRSMAIAWAYAKIPARAEVYRDAVQSFCRKRGIAFPTKGSPILVRKVISPLEKAKGQALISLLNQASGDARDSRADAYSRGTRFSPKTLTAIANALSDAESLRSYFDESDSLPLVEMLIHDGVIMDNERNRYMNDGYLNPEGKGLVEASLRAIVSPDLETIATMPAPVIAKIDAVIPHLLIASKVHERWNILATFTDAISLYGEWHRQDQKYDTFLKQSSFFQKSAQERYEKGAIEICRALIDLKKGEFVNKFKGFAGHAKISIEAGGLGMGLPVENAFEKYLGFPMPEKQDQAKVESPVIVETPEKAESPKTRKPREIKNDCTPHNSLRVLGTQTPDMDPLLAQCRDYFGRDISVTARCKKCFEVDGHPGFRIIRNGRSWQLRVLHAFVQEAADALDADAA